MTPEEQEWLLDLKEQLTEANVRLDARPSKHNRIGTPGRHWRSQQGRGRDYRHVLPGRILTQYGTNWFREQPRFDFPIFEVAVSTLLGVHDVDYAARMVTHQPPRPQAAIRHFRVDDLYIAGYVPMLTPSERNPRHVSLYYREICEASDAKRATELWAEQERVTLESLAITAGEIEE